MRWVYASVLCIVVLVGCGESDTQRGNDSTDPLTACIKKWNTGPNEMRAQLAGLSRQQQGQVLVTTDVPATTERVVGGTEIEIEPGDCIVAYADYSIGWAVHHGTGEWVAVSIASAPLSGLGAVLEQAEQAPNAAVNPDGTVYAPSGDE